MKQQEHQKWHKQPNGNRNETTDDECCPWPELANSNRGAFSVDEFCGWASIGRSKFYLEVAQGHIRTRKIGRKTVITFPDAVYWLQNLPEGGQP